MIGHLPSQAIDGDGLHLEATPLQQNRPGGIRPDGFTGQTMPQLSKIGLMPNVAHFLPARPDMRLLKVDVIVLRDSDEAIQDIRKLITDILD